MYTFLINMFFAFLAAISPGPNVVLVTQNSMVFGRKTGFLTALGVVCGVLFWLVFLAVGFVYLVQQPKVLFAFNCFASVYLFYVVYLVFKIKVQDENNSQITKKTFFLQSFIITLLNPEIAVFYGSILTGIFAKNPEFANSISHIFLYISGFMFVEAFVFFSVAFFVSSISKFMAKYIVMIKVLTSCAILYFAFKMILATHTSYHFLFA